MTTLSARLLLGIVLALMGVFISSVNPAAASGNAERRGDHTLAPAGETKVHSSTSPNAEDIARALNLDRHVEGGYFRRSYQADHRPRIATDKGERYLLTSIYYLLTRDSPVGHWHLNQSDILHFYHLGDPLRYSLIHPDGTLEQVVLGSDVTAGQRLQLMVKGGVWKSSELLPGTAGYGLISEAVSPGFDYEDMTIGSAEKLSGQFPQHRQLIEKFSKE